MFKKLGAVLVTIGVIGCGGVGTDDKQVVTTWDLNGIPATIENCNNTPIRGVELQFSDSTDLVLGTARLECQNGFYGFPVSVDKTVSNVRVLFYGRGSLLHVEQKPVSSQQISYVHFRFSW